MPAVLRFAPSGRSLRSVAGAGTRSRPRRYPGTSQSPTAIASPIGPRASSRSARGRLMIFCLGRRAEATEGAPTPLGSVVARVRTGGEAEGRTPGAPLLGAPHRVRWINGEGPPRGPEPPTPLGLRRSAKAQLTAGCGIKGSSRGTESSDLRPEALRVPARASPDARGSDNLDRPRFIASRRWPRRSVLVPRPDRLGLFYPSAAKAEGRKNPVVTLCVECDRRPPVESGPICSDCLHQDDRSPSPPLCPARRWRNGQG